MADERSAEIMDISETPDVAVWAKGIWRKAIVPSDKVKEPSKIASVTLYFTDSDKELMVDAANKKDVARAVKRVSLTDESGYGRQD